MKFSELTPKEKALAFLLELAFAVQEEKEQQKQTSADPPASTEED